MDAVDDESNVFLNFDHSQFDLPPETLTSPSSVHHFVGGVGEMTNDSVVAQHNYYNDANLDSDNVLDVSNGGVAYASFSSGADTINEGGGGNDLDNSDLLMSASSVVEDVASGLNCSISDTQMFAAEHQGLSNSASPDDKKSCTCKDCGKVFNSVWYLKQHAVKHSSERPFKCKYCHKTYRFRSNLYQHKCPLRDRASELASVAASNGKLVGDGSRKISSSTATDSPHPSSESSSSAEIAAAVAAAGVVRTRKRRAWPPLTSPPTSAASSSANGNEKNHKTKMRKGNSTTIGAEFSSDAATNSFKWDVHNRCAVSISSSTGSPTSPSSLNQLGGKQTNATALSDEDVQKFLDRHKDKLHKCPKCKSLWPSREYLTRHMEWHNDDSSRFRCVHCSETFVDERRYGLHKQNHSPSSLHVCGRCRGKFSTRVALKKHMRRCSLVDAKNILVNNVAAAVVGGGGGVQRSNSTIVNGYRQALFIDPTPPPSPTPVAVENGSIENRREEKETNSDIGENDAGNLMQLEEAAQQNSPSSYVVTDGGGGGGSKMSSDTNNRGGGNLSNGFGAVLENNNSLNGEMNFGIQSSTTSVTTTLLRMNNSNEILINSSNDIMFSTMANDSSSTVAALLPSEIANGSTDYRLSAIDRSGASLLFNVPENDLYSSIVGSSGISRSIWTSSSIGGGGEIAGQNYDAHSDNYSNDDQRDDDNGGDGDWLCEHNYAHNSNDYYYHRESGEANYNLQLQNGRPYFYHGRRLENVKSMAASIGNRGGVYDLEEENNSLNASIALGTAVEPTDDVVVYENGLRFSNIDYPDDFDQKIDIRFTDSQITKMVKRSSSSLSNTNRRKRYSNPMQATVPREMVEVIDSDQGNTKIDVTIDLTESIDQQQDENATTREEAQEPISTRLASVVSTFKTTPINDRVSKKKKKKHSKRKTKKKADVEKTRKKREKEKRAKLLRAIRHEKKIQLEKMKLEKKLELTKKKAELERKKKLERDRKKKALEKEKERKKLLKLNQRHICQRCQREYRQRRSLLRHEKKCVVDNTPRIVLEELETTQESHLDDDQASSSRMPNEIDQQSRRSDVVE